MSCRKMRGWELMEFYSVLGIAGQNLVIDGRPIHVFIEAEHIPALDVDEELEVVDGQP